jgi:protein associated with RNAse G/E
VHDFVTVVSVKHDGSAHRLWKKGQVVCKKPLVVRVDSGEHVVEADGREWSSPFPVFLWFHPDAWFNVIILCKKDGTGYYCNIASPPIFYEKENRYEFVDYDLDVIVETDGSYQVVDREEYNEHVKKFAYPPDVRSKVNEGLTELLSLLEQNREPFTRAYRETLFTLGKSRI